MLGTSSSFFFQDQDTSLFAKRILILSFPLEKTNVILYSVAFLICVCETEESWHREDNLRFKAKKTQNNMPGASTSIVKDVNPFFPEICLLVLLTVYYTILVMLDLRMWYWITDNPSLIFSLFSSIVCLKLLWYCREKLFLCHL